MPVPATRNVRDSGISEVVSYAASSADEPSEPSPDLALREPTLDDLLGDAGARVRSAVGKYGRSVTVYRSQAAGTPNVDAATMTTAYGSRDATDAADIGDDTDAGHATEVIAARRPARRSSVRRRTGVEVIGTATDADVSSVQRHRDQRRRHWRHRRRTAPAATGSAEAEAGGERPEPSRAAAGGPRPERAHPAGRVRPRFARTAGPGSDSPGDPVAAPQNRWPRKPAPRRGRRHRPDRIPAGMADDVDPQSALRGQRIGLRHPGRAAENRKRTLVAGEHKMPQYVHELEPAIQPPGA